MQDEKRERGRPRQDEPGRFYGKETKAPKVALTGRRARVYAPTDEIAQEVGGPNAVAVLDAKFVLPVELARRLKRAAAALKAQGLDVDASRLVELCLEGPLADIEATWNEGQPFPEPEATKTPRRPIPRAKSKPMK